MNKEELLAKKQAGTETFEVHWQYCENNEQKGNTISFDYDRKTIAIGTMIVKFSELTEYEYLHTYGKAMQL